MGLDFIGQYGGASLGEIEAKVKYRELVGSKVVMFYDHLDRAEYDLAAADVHISNMEAVTGWKIHDKIFFVRGSILGMNELHLLGMALGTDRSPKSWSMPSDIPPLSGKDAAAREDLKTDYGSLDRHEMAHVFIRQFVSAFARPPEAFIEGWAMNFAGQDSTWLAKSALIDKDHLPRCEPRHSGNWSANDGRTMQPSNIYRC